MRQARGKQKDSNKRKSSQMTINETRAHAGAVQARSGAPEGPQPKIDPANQFFIEK